MSHFNKIAIKLACRDVLEKQLVSPLIFQAYASFFNLVG